MGVAMSWEHKVELSVILEVSESYDAEQEQMSAAVEGRPPRDIGKFVTTAQRLLTPTQLSMLKDLALRAVDTAKQVGREDLEARETWAMQEEVAREVGIQRKSYGSNCLELEGKGLPVRKEGRVARYHYAMIYRFPTVEEFATALGFEGEHAAKFVDEVHQLVRQRLSKKEENAALKAVS